MTKFFRGLTSESIVVSVILLNGLALFFLASVEHESQEAGVWFAIDYGCIVFFVVEAMIKVRLDGWRRYIASGWNRLDFVVVLVSIPLLLTPVFDYQQLGGFTVLRLLRLFRLFRLMRFIPDRDKLAAGIVRSLRASIGVFLGVVLINVILAMGATFLFGEYAPEYFSNPLEACYSMFQIFTLEGWYEVPALIAERASEGWAVFARFYFVGAVFGGGIIGLSLANAVFVDQMVMDNNDAVESQLTDLTQEIRALRAEVAALKP